MIKYQSQKQKYLFCFLWGTWKSNFKMKIIKFIIISHSYVYYSHIYHLWTKHQLFNNFKIIRIVWFSNKKNFFKQSFKYLKKEKINLRKVILKLDCLFYQNIYSLFHLVLYSQSHFDSNKPKKRSNRKKTYFVYYFAHHISYTIKIINGLVVSAQLYIGLSHITITKIRI